MKKAESPLLKTNSPQISEPSSLIGQRKPLGTSTLVVDNSSAGLALQKRQGMVNASPMVRQNKALEEKINAPAVRIAQRTKWSLGDLDGKHTDVKWTPGTLGGDTVGIEMEANPLGPEHLQGGPPKSGVQKTLMSKLPTDPELNNQDKYIRGHLLNDNVGGPGDAYNLFPITGNANKEHESAIESKVKNWVNDQKQWVSYKVKVNPTKIDLPNETVNAQFICTASILDPSNQMAKIDTISATINSEYQQVRNTDVTHALPSGVLAGQGPQASVFAPLLSKSKKMQQAILMDEELSGHFQFLFSDKKTAQILKTRLMEYEGIGKTTVNNLSKLQDVETDKKVIAAAKKIMEKIGVDDLVEIFGDVYDELF